MRRHFLQSQARFTPRRLRANHLCGFALLDDVDAVRVKQLAIADVQHLSLDGVIVVIHPLDGGKLTIAVLGVVAEG